MWDRKFKQVMGGIKSAIYMSLNLMLLGAFFLIPVSCSLPWQTKQFLIKTNELVLDGVAKMEVGIQRLRDSP